MMRAFTLRRVGLIEEGRVGSVLAGKRGTADLIRLEGFLGRNGYPYTVLDIANSDDGHAIVERFGVPPDELPLMICPNGTVPKRPSDAEAAACLGITPELDPETIYDVAVGAGPAGLAAEPGLGCYAAISAASRPLFIGADPNVGWLDHCIETDEKGFVITGGEKATNPRPVLPLKTSQPGVFAIGDIRAGSTKRVASAVGEGAAVVA